MLEVIKLIEKTLKKKVNYKILNTAKNEIPYQSLDFSKIKKLLMWEPQYSIKSTIDNIESWYDANLR